MYIRPSAVRPRWHKRSHSHKPRPSLCLTHFFIPFSCPLVTRRLFQTGKGNSAGALFDVHQAISYHNVPCTTLQPVTKNIAVLGGQKVITFD